MEQTNKIKHLRDKKLEHFWEQGWNMVMTSSEPRKKPSQRLALKPVLPSLSGLSPYNVKYLSKIVRYSK